MEEPIPMRVARSGRGRAGAAAVGKPLFVVTGVIATLLFFQIWWVSDLPGEHTILERAFPLQASAQWMRDVLAAAQPPKFLSALTSSLVARDDRIPVGESKESERGSSLGPSLSNRDREPEATRREPALAVASMGAVEARASEAPPQVAQAPHNELPARLEPPVAATSPAASPPPVATQEAGAKAIRSEDIEILVARLVSYYEAGDVERVMALVDSRATGVWRALQSRNAFSDFFRATKQRRLRLNNLSWQIASGAAKAKGDATLRVEYFDGSGPAERRIDVEMDLRLHDGQLRIARLVLFPSDP